MVNTGRLERAWRLGYAAARDGQGSSVNPYSASSTPQVLSENWYAGWEQGMAQNERDAARDLEEFDRSDYQGVEAAALREDLANRCPHGVPYPDNCSACDHAADDYPGADYYPEGGPDGDERNIRGLGRR
jgi:ribosome modulation factor